MIVRSYGISIEGGNSAISIGDLFKSLEATSGQVNNLFNSPRMIFVDTSEDPDFYVGLIVTVKDQKTYCELVQNQGKLTISVVNLQNNLMEFNFFVVNKNNGLGIFQHYHHSCSPGAFFNYLKKRYRELTDKSRESLIEEGKKAGTLTRSAESKIRSNHAGALKAVTIVHKSGLAQVLKTYKRIKAFEFEAASIESEVSNGVPVSSYAVRAYRRFSFGDTPVGKIATAIQSTVEQLGITKGHVNVVDEVEDEDVPMSVKISNIPQNFGEQDFEVMTGLLNNMDAKDFAKHAVIKQLLSVCKNQHAGTFLQKLKTKRN